MIETSQFRAIVPPANAYTVSIYADCEEERIHVQLKLMYVRSVATTEVIRSAQRGLPAESIFAKISGISLECAIVRTILDEIYTDSALMARMPQIIPAFSRSEMNGIPESNTAITKGDAVTPPPPKSRVSSDGTSKVTNTTLSM